MENKDTEVRIKEIIAKIKSCEWEDYENWQHYKMELADIDPHNPQLELGFHGLPYFRGLID